MLNALKKHWWLVVILCTLAIYLRLYELRAPLADWHSFRQADTASVTLEFVRHNYPIWEPHYHDLSNVASGLDNPQGYRMVEFPIINYLIAQVLKINPNLDLVVTSRLVSIGFSILGLISLYGITYLLTKNRWHAGLAAFFYATLPYSIFYSRVILPEPAMLGTQLASLWFFIVWAQEKSGRWHAHFGYYLISLFFFSLSLLIKPTAIFIVPVFVVISLAYFGLSAIISPWLWAYALIGVGPMYAWRQWIKHFPEGIPASAWLLNSDGIRLRPAWWRWLFGERLGKLFLGYWGSGLAILGLIGRLRHEHQRVSLFDLITITWAGSMLLYLVIFATGNVRHDYYQVMLIPIIALLLARGVAWLFQAHYIRKFLSVPVILGVISLSLAMSWWEIRPYFSINHPSIVLAGQKADEILPADAKVIAPYNSDTAFLFQTQRAGWALGTEIEAKIAKGAQYYVSVNYDQETTDLIAKYTVLEETADYVIIDLSQPKL